MKKRKWGWAAHPLRSEELFVFKRRTLFLSRDLYNYMYLRVGGQPYWCNIDERSCNRDDRKFNYRLSWVFVVFVSIYFWFGCLSWWALKYCLGKLEKSLRSIINHKSFYYILRNSKAVRIILFDFHSRNSATTNSILLI